MSILTRAVFNWYWSGKLLPEGWRSNAKRQFSQRFKNNRHILEVWNGSNFVVIAECNTQDSLEAATRLLAT